MQSPSVILLSSVLVILYTIPNKPLSLTDCTALILPSILLDFNTSKIACFFDIFIILSRSDARNCRDSSLEMHTDSVDAIFSLLHNALIFLSKLSMVRFNACQYGTAAFDGFIDSTLMNNCLSNSIAFEREASSAYWTSTAR